MLKAALICSNTPRRAMLDDVIAGEAYAVEAFASVAEFLRVAGLSCFDMLMMNWDDLGVSGPVAIEEVRRIDGRLPILIVGDAGSEEDMAEALRRGADEFAALPVSATLLRAKMNAVVRRGWRAERPEAPEVFGDYAIDLKAQTVMLEGRPIALSLKEVMLARALFRNTSRTLSRDYLLQTIWGWSADVNTRTVDVHVARLRAKLSLRGEHGYRLATLYAEGYRLESVQPALRLAS